MRFAVVPFFLLGYFLISTAHNTSLVYDEVISPVAGLIQLKTGDMRGYAEHPALPKLASGLVLWLNHVPLPPELDPGKLDPWRIGHHVLFQSGLNVPDLFFWMRTPSMLMALATALLIFLWTQRFYGVAAGLTALGVLALDPLFIANGTLALDDTFVTFFSVAAFFSGLRFFETSRTRWALTTGLMAVAASTSKLSGLVVLHSSTSRYLLGELPARFHWVYYPVALLIKTPLPLFVFVGHVGGAFYESREFF